LYTTDGPGALDPLEQPHPELHGNAAFRRRNRARMNSAAVSATMVKAVICCQSMP